MLAKIFAGFGTLLFLIHFLFHLVGEDHPTSESHTSMNVDVMSIMVLACAIKYVFGKLEKPANHVKTEPPVS
jgi:hypothetical protein